MYKTLLWVITCFLFIHKTSAQLSVTTWVGNNFNWNANMNWDNGKPDINKIARFVPGANVYPVLNQPETIGGLQMEAGTYTIQFNGKLLNVVGEVVMEGGTLSGGTLYAGNFTDIQNASFQSMLLRKTGGDPSYFGGHTVFSGINTIEVAGTVPDGTTLYFGYTDGYQLQFNDSTTFVNQAAGITFEIAYDNGTVHFTKHLALVNTNPSSTFSFGKEGGTTTIASGKTIKLKPFAAGSLKLGGITQFGGMALDTLRPTNLWIENCHFGGRLVALPSSSINLISQSTFNANCRFEALQIVEVKYSTFSGNTVFRKTGAGDNTWDGGNVFSGTLSLINNGTGALKTAELAGDEFQGPLSIRRTGVGALQLGAGPGVVNQVKADISTLNTINPIQFGAIKFNGSALQTISGVGSFPYAFSDLRIDNANGLSLQVPINISGKLEFIKGVIFSDAINVLNFLNGTTHSGSSDSSYVQGPVRRSSLSSGFLFPTGDGGVYGPIGIETAGGIPTFTAQYFSQSPLAGGYDPQSVLSPIDHVSQTEYWTLNRNSAAGSAYVYMFWNGHSQVTQPDSIVVARWNGSKWADEGSSLWVGDPSAGFVVSAAPISNFSPFTLGSVAASPSNPLPIELLYFKAVLEDEQRVSLNWATATEQENDFFTVERSADGRIFSPIATLPGAGNSFEQRNYEAFDNQPLNGYSYYRLRQTDWDGQFSFSPIESVFRNEIGPIRIYPNPSSDFIYVDQWEGSQPPSVVIYTAAGQVVEADITHNPQSIAVNLSPLPPGYYWIKLVLGEENFVQKIIKK